MKLNALENLIARDKLYSFSILSIVSTAGMLINTSTISSIVLGALLSSIYFLINSIFIGRFFFDDESIGFRIAFGSLVLLMLIALGSTAVIVTNGLGILPTVLSTKVTILILTIITISVSTSYHIQLRRQNQKRKLPSLESN